MPVRLPVPSAFVLVLALGACAVPASRGGVVPDPYEAQNRRIHEFNRGVDRAVFRPSSLGYGAVLPAPAREGVANFSDNVSQPTYFINNLLQGRLDDAGHNLFRFAINSTLGVAGIFDPASSFSLERRESDFGETLHVWGAGPGAYLEVPFYGPSTQRDLTGVAVDLALNPFRALAPRNVNPLVFASFFGTWLNDRYVLRESVDQVLYESADSYLQSREIYLQNRRFELDGGDSGAFFDPYGDVYGDAGGAGYIDPYAEPAAADVAVAPDPGQESYIDPYADIIE